MTMPCNIRGSVRRPRRESSNRSSEAVLCRCLTVTETQVREAVALHGCQSVQEVGAINGAGEGCTVCHCKIRQLLQNLSA